MAASLATSTLATPATFEAACASSIAAIARNQHMDFAQLAGSGNDGKSCVLQRRIVMFGINESISCHYATPIFLKLCDQRIDIGNLDPGTPHGRLSDFQCGQARRNVHAIIGGSFLAIGFDFAFMMLGRDA